MWRYLTSFGRSFKMKLPPPPSRSPCTCSAFKSTGRRIGAVSISTPPLTTSASNPATQGQTSSSGTLTQHSVSSGAELLQSTGSAASYQQFYSYTAAPPDSDQARDLPPTPPVFTPAPAASYSFEGAWCVALFGFRILQNTQAPLQQRLAWCDAHRQRFSKSKGIGCQRSVKMASNAVTGQGS